jgi:hypothetical protein
MPAVSGSPASAGTRDTRVLRLTDQTAPLAEVASIENPNANPPTVNALDTATSTGATAVAQQAQVDTTETGRLTPTQQLKRAKPSAF